MIESNRVDDLLRVRLNRPERRNALTPEGLEALTRAIEGVSGDDRPTAVLVEAAGPVFCAGFDLTLCRDDGPEQVVMTKFLSELSACVCAMRACPSAVVLAVQGAAVAGGCALLGGADAVCTHADAKLGYPVVKLGISPAITAPFFAGMTTFGRARPALLDPGLFSGERALEIGLVDECVETVDEVLPNAEATALRLGAQPREAFAATKAWVNELEDGFFQDPDGARAGRALGASLSLVKEPESIERLAAVWSK